jgi:hypothetical protein
MEGALGGFMGGVGASYGLEQLDDANKLRDLERDIKGNELDEALLDKPNKAAKREFELESELPTKAAKNLTDLEWNQSGKAKEEKDEELLTKKLNNQKVKAASEALERGEWLEQAQPFLDPKAPQLGMQEAWDRFQKTKPKHMTYVPDGPLTPETRLRMQEAYKAYVNNGAQARAVVLQNQSQQHSKSMEDTRQDGLDRRAAIAAETSRANAAIRAKAPNSGELAMKKIGMFVQNGKDDPDNPLTPFDITAAESHLQKVGSKEGDAAKVDAILNILMLGKDRKTMTLSESEALRKQAVRSTYPPEGRRQLEVAEAALGLSSPPPLPPGVAEKVAKESPDKAPDKAPNKVPGSSPNPAAKTPEPKTGTGIKKVNGVPVARIIKHPDGTYEEKPL